MLPPLDTHPTMAQRPDITAIASAIGVPARGKMLSALMDGRALTATELALDAGVTVSCWDSPRPPEEIGGEQRAGRDDDAAHDAWVHLLRVVRAGVSADGGAHGHDDALRPDDGPVEDEGDERDAVADAREHRLHSVHGVDALDPHHGEHGEHEDARAGAEEADVDGDEELQRGGDPAHPVPRPHRLRLKL